MLVAVRSPDAGGGLSDLRSLIVDAIRVELAAKSLAALLPPEAAEAGTTVFEAARQVAADFILESTYSLAEGSVSLELAWYRASGGMALGQASATSPLDFSFDAAVARALDELVSGQEADIQEVASAKAEAERIASQQRAEEQMIAAERAAAEAAAAEKAAAEAATAAAAAAAEAQREAAERTAAEIAAAKQVAAEAAAAAEKSAQETAAAERRAAEAQAAAKAAEAQAAAVQAAASRPQTGDLTASGGRAGLTPGTAGLMRVPPLRPVAVSAGATVMVQTNRGDFLFHGVGVKAPLEVLWRFGVAGGFLGVGLASGVERFQVDGSRGSVLCTIVPLGAELAYGSRSPGPLDFSMALSGGPAVLVYQRLSNGTSVVGVIPFVCGGGGLAASLSENLGVSLGVGFEAIFAADAVFLALEPSVSLVVKF